MPQACRSRNVGSFTRQGPLLLTRSSKFEATGQGWLQLQYELTIDLEEPSRLSGDVMYLPSALSWTCHFFSTYDTGQVCPCRLACTHKPLFSATSDYHRFQPFGDLPIQTLPSPPSQESLLVGS